MLFVTHKNEKTNFQKVEAVSVSNYVDQKYYDWRGKPDIEEYIQGEPSEEFSVETYCEEALLDHHGSLRLVRWEAGVCVLSVMHGHSRMDPIDRRISTVPGWST